MNNKEPVLSEENNTPPAQEADGQWDMSGVEWGDGTTSGGEVDGESVVAGAEIIVPDEESEDDNVPEPELEKQPTIEEIRQMHIGYLDGSYEPSHKEWLLILEDKDFYQSAEYLSFRKQEIDEFADSHTEIYAPADEKIQGATQPFIEQVNSSINELLEIGVGFEHRRLTKENMQKIMDFFVDKFDVPDAPSLKLTHTNDAKDGYRTCGTYYDDSNEVVVLVDEGESVAGIIGTVAHEIWHAYQHQSEKDNPDYKYNFDNYYSASMDYYAYRNQLVEKEAKSIGDSVSNMYSKAFLSKHPDVLFELNDKYMEYLNGDYNPYVAEDGIDLALLRVAHREYAEYNKLSNVFKRLFGRKKK